MTKIIGLTGGIGSGKTTIANFFKAAAIPIYIADSEARNLMQSEEIKSKIKQVFGYSVFENDVLNRQKLAEIVFQTPEKLHSLNAIIHPAVAKHFANWLLNHQKSPFIIYEAAILFESGSFEKCDTIITVTAPLETRMERVLHRDKTSREHILQRMNVQWTDQQRISKSDFVIENINLESTKLQVDAILKILNNS